MGGIPCILGRKVLITQDIGLAFIANYAIHAGVIKKRLTTQSPNITFRPYCQSPS